MLRFRPIAPKPATGSSSSGELAIKKITRGRPKRKYVRAKKNYKNSESNEYDIDPTATMTTLQLFPNRTSDSDGGSGQGEWHMSDPTVEQLPVLIDFNRYETNNRSTVGFYHSNQSNVAAKESVVTVESVIDMSIIEGVELGRTDEERINNLEIDTCPGFVSDGHYNVRWINPAYSQTTCTHEESSVTLTVKAELPVEYPAFTCVVSLQMQDTRQNKGSVSSRVLPCDVWRMDFGGLAWRLDLGAALCLGR